MAVRKKKYLIYTDGSFRKPKYGAYAAIIIDSKHKHTVIKDGVLDTTISRMELLAIIVALESIKEPAEISVFSDSQYAIYSMSKWLRLWHINNYRNGQGTLIKNLDLMQRMYTQITKHDVTAIWVRGHANNFYNEHCDMLAGRITYLMRDGRDWRKDILLQRLEKSITTRRTLG